MSFEVRPEQPVDRDDVLRVIAAAFEGHGARGRGHLGDRSATTSGPASSWSRAGTCSVTSGSVGAWVDARRALVEVWVLSPLSVLPERQREGIGTALVAAAVETARGSGVPALFLEGSPYYYGARGFEQADGRGFLPAALERTPRPAFQCVCFDALEEWMTGQLIYPEVWWTHDAAGLRDPGSLGVRPLDEN